MNGERNKNKLDMGEEVAGQIIAKKEQRQNRQEPNTVLKDDILLLRKKML